MAHQNQYALNRTRPWSTFYCKANALPHAPYHQYINPPAPNNHSLFCYKIHFHYAHPYNAKNTNYFPQIQAWYWFPIALPSKKEYSLADLLHQGLGHNDLPLVIIKANLSHPLDKQCHCPI